MHDLPTVPELEIIVCELYLLKLFESKEVLLGWLHCDTSFLNLTRTNTVQDCNHLLTRERSLSRLISFRNPDRIVEVGDLGYNAHFTEITDMMTTVTVYMLHK